MTTAIDTNVLVALWDTDTRLNTTAQKALDSAQERGALVIPGAVYAELLALPGRTERMLDGFLEVTRIRIDWESREGIWRAAGKAFQNYVGRAGARKTNCPAGFSRIFILARMRRPIAIGC